MKVHEASFAQFVFPFTFRAKHFEPLCQQVDKARWSKDRHLLDIWHQHRFETDELLPHVAQYLNPEHDVATAKLWKLNDQVLRHALRGDPRAQNAFWKLHAGSKNAVEVDFCLEGVKLSLFCAGVGLLVFSSRPGNGTLEAWLDFVHYFRFSDGQRQVKVSLLPAEDPPPTNPLCYHYFKDAVQDPKGWRFDAVIEGLLKTASTPGGPGHHVSGKEENWWKEIFVPGRMLPFISLFIDHEASDRDSMDTNSLASESNERLRLRVRKFFHSRQEIYPSSDDLSDQHPALYCYAKDQWFTFSLDGGAFVAFDPPDTVFFRETLPAHLRHQYFLLFTIALHQRCLLMHLSAEVARRWLAGSEVNHMSRETAFREIRDTLLMFTARGYFTQIMQRQNHHACYRRWQGVFQVEDFYREVSEEVREMHNYLLFEQQKEVEARTQALQDMIGYVSIGVGIPALVIGFLGINLHGFTAGEGLPLLQAAAWGLGGAAVATLIVGCLIRFRSADRRNSRRLAVTGAQPEPDLYPASSRGAR